MKTFEQSLKEELNIDRLSTLEYSGIIRAHDKYASQFKTQEQSLTIPDIRNKLSPITNLIAMIENEKQDGGKDIYEAIKSEIEQCKKSIKYLSQFKTVEPNKLNTDHVIIYYGSNDVKLQEIDSMASVEAKDGYNQCPKFSDVTCKCDGGCQMGEDETEEPEKKQCRCYDGMECIEFGCQKP